MDIAIVVAALLFLARVLRLGFLADEQPVQCSLAIRSSRHFVFESAANAAVLGSVTFWTSPRADSSPFSFSSAGYFVLGGALAASSLVESKVNLVGWSYAFAILGPAWWNSVAHHQDQCAAYGILAQSG